jgi:hypothetical protein
LKGVGYKLYLSYYDNHAIFFAKYYLYSDQSWSHQLNNQFLMQKFIFDDAEITADHIKATNKSMKTKPFPKEKLPNIEEMRHRHDHFAPEMPTSPAG